MRRLFVFISLLTLSISARATTVTLNPSMTQAQVQTAVSASAGVNGYIFIFSGSITSYAWAGNSSSCNNSGSGSSTCGVILPCSNGQIYEGPTPSSISQPTATIAPTYTNSYAFYFQNCSGASPGLGAIMVGLQVQKQNIYISAGSSGLLIAFNWINGMTQLAPGGSAYPDSHSYASVFFEGTTTSGISNSRVSWNNIGNNCRDITEISTYSDNYGTCGAIAWHGNASNLEIDNNYSTGPTQEMIKGISAPTGTYNTISNIYIHNNDLAHVHRMGIEMQNDTCGGPSNGIVIQYNDLHDQYNPDGGSFGISTVHCATAQNPGGVPSLNGTYNILIANVAAGPSCGTHCYLAYAWENGGTGPNVNLNLIQGLWNQGVSWQGQGSPVFQSSAGQSNNNIIQGPNFSTGGGHFYVGCENGGTFPTSCNYVTGTIVSTGNTLGTTPIPQVSASPSISPATGSYSGPQTVTITNAGVNTSSYCTDDGTTPVPGAGTTFLYTTPFLTGSLPAVVKCVGQWGTGANPLTYPLGYGYTNSTVQTATYSPSSTTGVTINVKGINPSNVIITTP